ncbi:MAG: hypothetical protein EBU08_19445 [Micrococcales bacterium]|jgi:hypothetical protein|nr:hypothetical protein [Micrococcales bacterium]
MAMVYKILGQKSPAATTDFNLYTVSGSKQAIINCITVANRDANSATYRISVRPDGATLTTDHYIAYDVQVGSNLSVALNLGITLDTNDVITVQSSSGLVTFNAYGVEIDV